MIGEIKYIIIAIFILGIGITGYFGFNEIVRLKSNEIQLKQTQQILIHNLDTITASLSKQEEDIKVLQQKYNTITTQTTALQKKMDAAILENMGRKDPKELRDYINKTLKELFEGLSQ